MRPFRKVGGTRQTKNPLSEIQESLHAPVKNPHLTIEHHLPRIWSGCWEGSAHPSARVSSIDPHPARSWRLRPGSRKWMALEFRQRRWVSSRTTLRSGRIHSHGSALQPILQWNPYAGKTKTPTEPFERLPFSVAQGKLMLVNCVTISQMNTNPPNTKSIANGWQSLFNTGCLKSRMVSISVKSLKLGCRRGGWSSRDWSVLQLVWWTRDLHNFSNRSELESYRPKKNKIKKSGARPPFLQEELGTVANDVV